MNLISVKMNASSIPALEPIDFTRFRSFTNAPRFALSTSRQTCVACVASVTWFIPLPIGLRAKNQLAVVASAHHVIYRSGILNYQRGMHGRRVWRSDARAVSSSIIGSTLFSSFEERRSDRNRPVRTRMPGGVRAGS
jgi:hypothetical protein